VKTEASGPERGWHVARLLQAANLTSQYRNPLMQMMNRNVTIGLLSGSVAASGIALMTGMDSLSLVAVSGFFFVIGGTVLTAVLSEGRKTIESLFRRIPAAFADRDFTLGADEDVYLKVATYYRSGRVPMADLAVKEIRDSYLQLGSRLVIDRCHETEISRALQWQASYVQEQERRELRILQSMGGFAPAFGMLGTLLGLVHLLFNLGDGGLEVVGSAMGFAMITTIYGLVTSNLIIRPTAIKMEQRLREQHAWQRVKFELVMLLYEKAHPTVIQETLHAFTSGQHSRLPVTGSFTASMVSA
jgi:chemotaxis protein MotA